MVVFVDGSPNNGTSKRPFERERKFLTMVLWRLAGSGKNSSGIILPLGDNGVSWHWRRLGRGQRGSNRSGKNSSKGQGRVNATSTTAARTGAMLQHSCKDNDEGHTVKQGQRGNDDWILR